MREHIRQHLASETRMKALSCQVNPASKLRRCAMESLCPNFAPAMRSVKKLNKSNSISVSWIINIFLCVWHEVCYRNNFWCSKVFIIYGIKPSHLNFTSSTFHVQKIINLLMQVSLLNLGSLKNWRTKKHYLQT